MKVWVRLDHFKKNLKDPPLILALGNFDGVHKGHQKIIERVVARGRELKGLPAVFTFSEHPQRVLHHSSEPALLTSPQHRLLLLQEKGIEIGFLLPFTEAFSKTNPEQFVEEWLVAKLGVQEIHLGYNAHFGFGRRGDVELMKILAKRIGFRFYEAESVEVDGEFVSSSLIRRVIREGDLAKARRLLGRPFSIFASVIRGKGRGKNLGFPTANLRPHSEILPPRGVYPVQVRESNFHLKSVGANDEFELITERPGPWRQGVLNYGVRPTFEEGEVEVPEVFLWDYSGDLYGKTVEVVFHPRLREEKEFRSSEELVQAIERDVESAQRYFGDAGLYK